MCKNRRGGRILGIEARNIFPDSPEKQEGGLEERKLLGELMKKRHFRRMASGGKRRYRPKPGERKKATTIGRSSCEVWGVGERKRGDSKTDE